MIRRRDEIRLCVQKLGLRKRRAAFAIVSVALGIVVVVAVSSLLEGVRAVVLKTLWSEEIDPAVIQVFAQDNPYDSAGTGPEQEKKAKKRYQFLTETDFETTRQWPEVEAADRPVELHTLSVDALARQPRPLTGLRGVPEALLRRYVKDPALLSQCSNAIPLVVGERNVRLRYNDRKKKLEFEPPAAVEAWLGREVTILLGDNYASISRYRYDDDKREYTAVGDDDLAAQREIVQRNYAANYDPVLFNNTLPLKARIVGFCPGRLGMIPVETAALCDKWLTQRNQLASLRPSRESDSSAYEMRGRRNPRPGEYTEGMVVVRPGANVEAVAQRIEKLGFTVATRARTFENQARAFDSGLRVVKRIAYAFGAVILGLACAMVWSTTSKVVSDSRTDIGLFRALGATKRDIRRLFLGDSVVLGLLGTLAGMILGWVLAIAVSHWVIGFAQREVSDPEDALLIPNSIFSVDWKFCVALLAGAVVVSLLAGLIPANRAANVDPVKALKRE